VLRAYYLWTYSSLDVVDTLRERWRERNESGETSVKPIYNSCYDETRFISLKRLADAAAEKRIRNETS